MAEGNLTFCWVTYDIREVHMRLQLAVALLPGILCVQPSE